MGRLDVGDEDVSVVKTLARVAEIRWTVCDAMGEVDEGISAHQLPWLDDEEFVFLQHD